MLILVVSSKMKNLLDKANIPPHAKVSFGDSDNTQAEKQVEDEGEMEVDGDDEGVETETTQGPEATQ